MNEVLRSRCKRAALTGTVLLGLAGAGCGSREPATIQPLPPAQMAEQIQKVNDNPKISPAQKEALIGVMQQRNKPSAPKP